MVDLHLCPECKMLYIGESHFCGRYGTMVVYVSSAVELRVQYNILLNEVRVAIREFDRVVKDHTVYPTTQDMVLGICRIVTNLRSITLAAVEGKET